MKYVLAAAFILSAIAPAMAQWPYPPQPVYVPMPAPVTPNVPCGIHDLYGHPLCK